ncbi:CheY-like chemotaxis protein [Methanomicrobium sp. W14]|uniref:response regulator n=1 Tax=Methanomicrobium sp. W14 TaxID=2817839 RepID=UPI001FD97DBE|nr:response regulator [Methanomicrobium sp. W14]MBP2133523.1 CheY-like chemotaxis protein [Methanomicrobium sp. W14]
MMIKILIVEDNPNNFYLIQFILQKNGFEVIWAKTGEEGVVMASGEKPSLILMDIQLPGIDGYEATRRIRENKALSEIPIIAVTSYAMTGDREKSLRLGCTGYIEKPIDPDKIVSQIMKFLD